MYTRNQTRVISIGDVKIGGGNPVAIQSMTNTKTENVEEPGEVKSITIPFASGKSSSEA